MSSLYARSVFFVNNAERSLRFYTEQLGFKVDWDDFAELGTPAIESSEITEPTK